MNNSTDNKWWCWMNQSGLIIVEKLMDIEDYEEFCATSTSCIKCSEIFEAANSAEAKQKSKKALNFKSKMWIREM